MKGEKRKNYRRLKNEWKRAKEKTKKEYAEGICDEIIEFQSNERYDSLCMKTRELSWKENQGIKNTGVEYSQVNVTTAGQT
jgi:hypothetical protein